MNRLLVISQLPPIRGTKFEPRCETGRSYRSQVGGTVHEAPSAVYLPGTVTIKAPLSRNPRPQRCRIRSRPRKSR